MTADHPDLTQPHGAPDQKQRVLDWLRTEPGGLTQLDALQHLAVARLAAVIYRLRTDDGHVITTELIELPTRYGPAQVARYHLAGAHEPTLDEIARAVSTLPPGYCFADAVEHASPRVFPAGSRAEQQAWANAKHNDAPAEPIDFRALRAKAGL